MSLRTVRSLLERASGQLPYLWRALALVWAAAPRWTAGWLALLVLQGLLPIAVVYLTRWVVDSVVALLGAGASWATLRPALLPAALMAAVLLLGELLRSLTAWVRTAQSELVRDHVSELVLSQSASVDLGFYEMPEFYDRLHRARHDAAGRPLALVEALGGLGQNGITLLAMAGVLIPFGTWLPLALIVSTVPALYVALSYGLRHHAWKVRRTTDERRADYYEWLLTTEDSAAEVRLFSLGAPLRAAFQAVRRSLRRDEVALARSQSRAEIAAAGFALLITAAAMVWMIWRAAQGTASLGDLALFYQAFNQGQGLLRNLLENVGRIYTNVLFLGDLFAFLGLESKLARSPHPSSLPAVLRDGVRFEAVTFTYPGNTHPALRDFDLFLPAGRLAAIVGRNGAGKSTLMKLLCRFYDPDQGRILVDGVDLREFDPDQVRTLVSALFQQPMSYEATVADNIAMGARAAPTAAAALRRAARRAGVDALIDGLPQQYATPLGRWLEDGAELSVGEWQRLALARAFFREAPLVLLDEPTSAMDAWTEIGWMDRLRASVAGHTALVITHRFTTAMRTDLIFVMDEGRVVEQGTHHELLAAGGRYADSWRQQTATDAPAGALPGET